MRKKDYYVDLGKLKNFDWLPPKKKGKREEGVLNDYLQWCPNSFAYKTYIQDAEEECDEGVTEAQKQSIEFRKEVKDLIDDITKYMNEYAGEDVNIIDELGDISIYDNNPASAEKIKAFANKVETWAIEKAALERNIYVQMCKILPLVWWN